MNYIVDDIRTIVKRMNENSPFKNPQREMYYLYGHRQYIANTLLEQDNDRVYKHRKYPLVALRLDTVERHGDLIEYSLNIGFFEFSIKEDIDKRYDKVFKKTLYPMYESFLTELNDSGLFEWPGFLVRPPHVKIDRPFWGTEGKEGNTAYIFNDPLDAIEILDLKINQTIKC
jgi:hypothetical protein